MMQLRFAAALTAALSLAACSGNSGQSLTNPLIPPAKTGPLPPAQVLSIAGVGDSLTAGVQ